MSATAIPIFLTDIAGIFTSGTFTISIPLCFTARGTDYAAFKHESWDTGTPQRANPDTFHTLLFGQRPVAAQEGHLDEIRADPVTRSVVDTKTPEIRVDPL